jgi:hypothetical protein
LLFGEPLLMLSLDASQGERRGEDLLAWLAAVDVLEAFVSDWVECGGVGDAEGIGSGHVVPS